MVLPGKGTCQPHLQNPIAPMGDSRVARCLQGGGVYVSSGTVTITSSSIYGNTAYFVRDQVQKFPSPRWEFLLTCPYQLSSFNLDQSLVLPGICTCQPHLQNPIAPMGKVLTGLPRFTLAQLRTLRSTTGGVCHRDLENFLSPRWETHVLLAVCRAAVSMSLPARSR